MSQHEQGLPEDLIDAKDVARIIGLHYRTVLDMAEKGEIPAYRIRNRYRFSRREITDWLTAQRVIPPDQQ